MAKKTAKNSKKKPTLHRKPSAKPKPKKSTAKSVAPVAQPKSALERYFDKLRQKFPLLNRKEPAPLEVKPLPNGWRLLIQSWQTVRAQPKLFLGLFIVYIVLVAALVQAGPQGDFNNLKNSVGQVIGGNFGALSQTGTFFVATFFGAFGQALTAQQLLTLNLLGLLFWLVFLAAARHAAEEKKVRIRDILYTAPGPFLPFLTVILITCLRLAPGIFATLLFLQAYTGGYIQHWFELILWVIGTFALIAISLYWLVGSVIALVIASLPKVYPLVAFSSAKQLVRARHYEIILRLALLVVWIIALWIIALLPFILVGVWINISGLISIFIQLLTQATLVFVVIYSYRLYRSLLK